MLFICQVNPYLRVYNPETEGFAEFKGGKLQLDPGDEDYEVVLAEAKRNPSIVILTEATICPECGEAFAGKAAPVQLGQHRKEAHFEAWVADKEKQQDTTKLTEVKHQSPHPCDLCSPMQSFRSADELAVHIRAIHLTVDVDESGNVHGEGSGPASKAPAEPKPAKAR